MFQRAGLPAAVLAALALSFAGSESALAGRIDLPCEIGPMFASPGTIAAGPNGPAGAERESALRSDMMAWREEIQQSGFYESKGLFALNHVDGFSHDHRSFFGIHFTHFEFDEFDGGDIPEIRTDLLTLEAGVQLGKHQKRATRVGVRVPYVDYRDSDPADPASASDFFDVEIFADFGLSWDDEPEGDNPFLTGMVFETRLTLPTGDEEDLLGREDATLGVRPRWFLRWTPERVGPESDTTPVTGEGVRLTQVHFSAGLGYVWDLGVSENSYWSPVVGVFLAWSDRLFLELELQGELHDSGLDQYDWLTELSFRLLPETGRRQVFLSVGGLVALNDEGLRDSFAPTVGVTFAFGQVPPKPSYR